jgi:hypothetical protein
MCSLIGGLMIKIKKLFFVLLLFLSGSLLSVSDANAAKQPNIVWFVIDDLSTNFSCCD